MSMLYHILSAGGVCGRCGARWAMTCDASDEAAGGELLAHAAGRQLKARRVNHKVIQHRKNHNLLYCITLWFFRQAVWSDVLSADHFG